MKKLDDELNVAKLRTSIIISKVRPIESGEDLSNLRKKNTKFEFYFINVTHLFEFIEKSK